MNRYLSDSRRGFLKSSTALIALPFLESLPLRQVAKAAIPQTVTPPKRMVFLGIGFGVTADTWYPDKETVGENYKMPKTLKALEKHKDDISFIQNLEHQFSKDGHYGSTYWLTGANRYAIPGQSFHNTVSADQVAAEQLGKQTRFTSIQLASRSNSEDGHGTGLSLAWNRNGKPVSALDTPVATYHRLFSDDKTPLEQKQHLLAEQRSVLDTVMTDAKAVNKKINKNDARKLDEYFESIREIEVRLEKEERWLGVPKKTPSPSIREPQESLEGVEEIRVMYDLMYAAMQVDASRVFTYRMPANSMIASLGAEISAHSMSHYSAGERRQVSEKRDKYHAILLSEFMDKLKSHKESDGSTLLDNTSIAFGSNLRSVHSLNNCPTLIAGGGAGVKQGRHIVLSDKKTPLNNLWLSLLQGVGVNVESHGDSTGRLEELFKA